MNETTGEIRVEAALSHRMASVVVLTVRAVDANAADNVAGQFDEAEVTLFVRPHANRNPVFADAAGLPDVSSAPIVVGVDEEMPVGSVLLRLAAVDALTNRSLHGFRPVGAVPRQIAIGRAGDVVLAERLDYETLPAADKVSTGGLGPGRTKHPSPGGAGVYTRIANARDSRWSHLPPTLLSIPNSTRYSDLKYTVT